MKINRSELLQQIVAFFQIESGVVIGEPGVGKSYLLSEMVCLLVEQDIPATVISLDFLTEGTEEEIAEVLSITGGKWIDSLQRIGLPATTKGVLIFDGYDTIKDEKLKTNILKQIAKAKRELPGWSIIASVRTYDATRSQKLISLFPATFNDNNIYCRHFAIPPLSDLELNMFLSSHEKLNAIYQEGTKKLRDILKIPFFLSLLDTILTKTDTSTDVLKVLKSEIELLDMYWVKVVYRVFPISHTQLFLRNLTLKMVEGKILSVDKLDHLGGLNTENILIAEQLLSENVLTEQGSHTLRIAYTHNILFDFAVSKLVLKDSAAELLAFITADQARPFFLRPSFIYFFARLWYADPAKFWAIYNELSQNTDEVIFLFNKLMPSSVLAREFDEIGKLEFLRGNEPYKVNQISNILQALRFLKDTTNRVAQAYLLFEISAHLQVVFVWDFAILLEGLIIDARIQSKANVFGLCGQAARNLMDFLMANPSNANLDQLAAHRGTSLVAKTYLTDVNASRNQLKTILDKLNQPGFNIAYFSTLTASLKEFYRADPEFCVIIFERVFGHEENSNDPAPMHTGVLYSFTSSRHDQFSSCQYRLQQFFPTFIQSFPQLAIPLGLEISNSFIRNRNGDGIRLPDSITTPFDFSIDGENAHYQVDMSHFWGEHNYQHKPIQFTEYVIEYFERLLNSDEIEVLTSSLKLYWVHAYNAYNWRSILEFGAKYADILHSHLLELLLQPAILCWNDTVVATGSFMEAAFPFYNTEQLNQLEQAILSLPKYFTDAVREKADHVVLRLLSRIPKDRLTDERSARILPLVPIANEPLVNFSSSSEVFTTEMFLVEEGVDIHSPENEALLTENSKMERFVSTFLNHIPDVDDYAESFRSAVSSFALIKDNSQIPQQVKETLLTNIASVCKLVLRSHHQRIDEAPLTIEQYATIKEIILFCLEYYTDSDAFAENNSSPGLGYSATPRIESACALPILFVMTKDPELLPVIKQYSIDKNPVTRFGIARSLFLLYALEKELYWQIVYERLANETDWFTKSFVINSLTIHPIITNEPDRLIEAYHKAKLEIYTIAEGNNSYLDSFWKTALVFLMLTGDDRISYIIQECLQNNISIGKNLVNQAFKLIEPENFNRNYSNDSDIEKSQRVVDCLMKLLDLCEQVLVSVEFDNETTKDVEDAFKIIHTVISRINFSMQNDKNILDRNTIRIKPEHQERFYFIVKPLLEKILIISRQLDNGFMQGSSAHYFIEIMGGALRFDAHFSLAATSEITTMALRSNYTFDPSAIEEVVKYTEQLLTDHKSLLAEPVAFAQIIGLLNLYVQSGWPQAIDLLWKLDEIFR